jgi:putative SOS response-associated peptidase YedK
MCGRFSLRARLAELAEHFEIPEAELPPLGPRYNIAPTQPVLVIRMRADDPAAGREAAVLRWGLIPSWAKTPAVGGRLINARAEGLAEKPAFRAACRRRRCLVAADGFYEWGAMNLKSPEGDRLLFPSSEGDTSPAKGKKRSASKQPYFVRFRDDRPFAFAGLWETWEAPDHTAVESCTIITTAANALLRPIHDRMPVILPRSAYAPWLDPARQTPDALLPLLVFSTDKELEAYPVGPLVNRAAHDAPECVERL